MSLVLYRKYRPKKFEEVLGQDHIVEVLKGAVSNGKVAHAYLFSGPRGCGKTSVARILAKSVGCHEYDMHEIDGASNRGIEEIRGLRDSVHTMPLRGTHKVYIIDEVHMLTGPAFNAFLKTLEEPPEHVIFILATTEAHKLPDTIVSRCQHFIFKKITEEILAKSMKSIAKREDAEVDEETASLIALFAEGSFRDAQMMLDQLLGAGEKKITGEMARRFLAVPASGVIRDFVKAIADKEAEKNIVLVGEMASQGTDLQAFLKLVLRQLRALLIMKTASSRKDLINSMISAGDIDFIEGLKDKLGVGDIGYALVVFLEAYDSVSRAYLPQLPIELALAKIQVKSKAGQ
jgi:DNA polymerase-3 subunit gamma/tau